jgi:STE24 endopeptidase
LRVPDFVFFVALCDEESFSHKDTESAKKDGRMNEINEQGAAAAPDERAREYHRLRISLSVLGIVLEVLLAVVLVFSGASIRIRELVEQIVRSRELVVAGYVIFLGLIYEALFLPLHFYKDFRIEHRFGLSNENLGQWAQDYAKAALLEFAFALGLIEILYYLLGTAPMTWWVIFAGVVIVVFVLLAKIFPVLILPLFFKLKPLENEELAARLKRLAQAAGIRVSGIYEWGLSKKTRAANAALVGLGGTRRVLLADTLLQSFPPEEIEAVVAHEFGHHARGHMAKGILAQAITVIVFLYASQVMLGYGVRYFGFRGIADVANLPLIALVFAVAGVVAMPVLNGLLRRFERAADAFACARASDPRAFISALSHLAALNLAHPHPHPVIEFIFYSHPSIQKRIASCEKLCEQKNCTVGADTFNVS